MPIREWKDPAPQAAEGPPYFIALCDACGTFLADQPSIQPRLFLSEPGAASCLKDHRWFHFKQLTICRACLEAHIPKPPTPPQKKRVRRAIFNNPY